MLLRILLLKTFLLLLSGQVKTDTRLSCFSQYKILFKIIRIFVFQIRMKTIAVIKHFDVLDHITSRIVLSTINYIGSPFGFQTVKETLRNSIIPAIALSTHAADHAIDTQELPVITAGILAAAVRVVNQSLSRFPSPISHRKSIRDKRCLYPAAHSPTNNFSRIQIEITTAKYSHPSMVHR